MTKPPPRDFAVQKTDTRLGFNPFRAVLGALRGDRVMAVTRVWRPRFKPAFDVKEERELYILKADLPGVRLEDVEVMLGDNRIQISGRREEENGHGKFSRTLPLPRGVDVNRCEADLHDGVLTLELPKTPEAVMKKLVVKSEKTRA